MHSGSKIINCMFSFITMQQFLYLPARVRLKTTMLLCARAASVEETIATVVEPGICTSILRSAPGGGGTWHYAFD